MDLTFKREARRLYVEVKIILINYTFPRKSFAQIFVKFSLNFRRISVREANFSITSTRTVCVNFANFFLRRCTTCK